MSDKHPSSLELASEMINLDLNGLNDSDVAQLQRLILDYAAVTLCGSIQPWGRKMRAWSQDQNASGPARLIGSGDLTNAATAALANGTAAHGYELDDTHEASSSHPGAVVISAALAVAAESGSSGRDILAAIAAGYEAMTRIGRAAISQEVTERGFHATCLFGIGAQRRRPNSGVGCRRSRPVLGPRAVHGQRFLPVRTRATGNDGQEDARRDPVDARRPRSAAWKTGNDGAAKFTRRSARFLSPLQRKSEAGASREEDWRAARNSQHQLQAYSCCRKFHSMIDCLEIATAHFTHDPADIAKIDVYSPANAIKKHAIRRPNSVMAAQYSMPYITAATLAYGPKKYSAFETGYHNDPTIISLIDKTEAHHDPKLTTIYRTVWRTASR